MVLTNKVILVISSEAWGKIFISKHHYAATLANLGNTVYFLNPIDYTLRVGEIKIESSSTNKDLFIIRYRPFFPWIFKFHAKWLFEILISIQVKKILRKLPTKIDIVWDFNCSYLYNDLSVFNAGTNIFHPVDKLSADAGNKKADIVFSVSPLILEEYKFPDVPRYLINHGLSEKFEPLASEEPLPVARYNEKIKACYIGNLLSPSLNRDIIKQIVSNNPGVDFHFIGPFTHKGNNIYPIFNAADKSFIDFLTGHSNVILTGILSSEEIAKEITKFDLFFMCYQNSPSYRCDNSHKIVEYLSTGKVIISTPVLFYQNTGLLLMSNTEADYNKLFSEVISNLPFYNSIELMRKRKAFAKDNTYQKQILRIADHITQNIEA